MNCFLCQLWIAWLTLSLVTPGQAVAASASSQGPELIAMIHSAGLGQVGSDANGRTFKEIWSLPVSAQLRDETLSKVAVSLAASFEGQEPGSSNCVALIRPLMNDLCEAEVLIEMMEHPHAVLDCVLALRLDPARAKLWQDNWSKLLSHWKLRNGADHLAVLSSNGWFTVRWTSGGTQGSAPESLPHNSVLQKLQQGQRPVAEAHENWLTLQADLARCLTRLGRRSKADLPKLDLAVNGRKEFLRSEARLTFREPVAARSEKWQIPMNTIRDPLISFTALQGFGAWLGSQPWLKELGLDKIPNQFFVWGLSQTAFQVQAAVPVPDESVTFNSVEQHWVPSLNQTLSEYAAGNLVRLTNRTEIVWHGTTHPGALLAPRPRRQPRVPARGHLPGQSTHQRPASSTFPAIDQPNQPALLRLGSHSGAAQPIASIAPIGGGLPDGLTDEH